MKKPSISIIGAGNVGTQLALAFFSAGYTIQQICSRKPQQASLLAKKVNAAAILDISELEHTADIYLLCIPDQAIRDLSHWWKIHERLVCHTSGSTEMQVLSDLSAHYGVFYPLQTFSSKKNIRFTKVPLCIEANTPDGQELLYKLGRSLSGNVRYVDSSKRLAIHLAAVIAGNFSNYMYVIAEEILQKHGFSFSLLHPLIKETSSKAIKISPYHAQTGPALRKDMDVIRKHLEMLESKPEMREIYDQITTNIMKSFQ